MTLPPSTLTFTPAEACEIVTKATDFHMDPKVLRQWRNRGLFYGGSREDEGGWTRFNLRDVFQIAFMAEMIRSGYPARTAANLSAEGRNYAPATDGLDYPGDVLVIPGVFSGDEDDNAWHQHRFRCHIQDLAGNLLKLRDKVSARACLIIDLSDMRERFTNAAMEVQAAK